MQINASVGGELPDAWRVGLGTEVPEEKSQAIAMALGEAVSESS